MSQSVIYFGGLSISIIAEYRNDIWRKLGEMAKPRAGHRSIEMDGKIFIFGGDPTESPWNSRFILNHSISK